MKIRKQKIALALALVLMFAWVSPSLALTDMEIEQQVYQNAKAERERVAENGKYSSDHLNQSVIDLTYISQGSVMSYVYTGNNQNLTTTNHDVNPQSVSSARDKITRFVFQVRNMYYPHNSVVMSGIGENIYTVNTWTYGPDKNETMFAIVNGMEECLNNVPITSGSSGGSARDNPDNTWLEKYTPEQIENTISLAAEQISLYISSSRLWFFNILSSISDYISTD